MDYPRRAFDRSRCICRLGNVGIERVKIMTTYTLSLRLQNPWTLTFQSPDDAMARIYAQARLNTDGFRFVGVLADLSDGSIHLETFRIQEPQVILSRSSERVES